MIEGYSSGKIGISSDHLLAVGNIARECDQLTFIYNITAKNREFTKETDGECPKLKGEKSADSRMANEKRYKEEEDNVKRRIDIDL